MSYHVESICDRRRFGSATRKQIVMYLANKASDDGTGIWCSKHTIARHTELSLATVKRVIRDFLAEGILLATGLRDTSRHGQTVVYRIVLEAVEELELLQWSTGSSTTGVTLNPVPPVPATGVTVSPQPGSGRPPNNPKNHPENPPSARTSAREAADADLEPLWEAYPADRRRDRKACGQILAGAQAEASSEELTEAARTYAAETADYTRTKVMFLDNWLRTGKWRRYVEEARGRAREKESRARTDEETMIRSAARWILERSAMCRHVPRKYALKAVERGLITLRDAQAAGVL
ncbi:hypothetical protein EOW65_07860 [Sinirhodobacter ferrireducens]|uniref:Helix-turn-helix domain-containing protein n=1 Tax=Paenirhodobacter ferrireducens TaxID=1215032 RepID=A0A443LKY4_9RHOB|nr:hypothetical protein [Sinirhodobacter ferrireducens]RWR49861.1 hypothetical protein EOW65_07860 [Sinirhodobacter ferrireducens]